jgi:kynureninase
VYYVLRGMLPPTAELVMAPGYDGIAVDVQAIVDAIDEHTLLVPISHVLFRSAYIMDIAPIIEKAHKVGALVIVDGYHASGIIPVDVQALNADIYLGGVLKWMCGGPGGVFMVVRPDHLRTLRPGLTGWMAHKRPFGFETADIDFRDDAFRFLNGTLAVPSLYANLPGVEIIAKVGVDAIREKSLRQTEQIVEMADQLGYLVNSPRDPAKRGGTVTVSMPHVYEVSRELIARNVVIDYRANAGIRISPHFYNSDEEIEQAFAQIQDILATNAWGKHANAQSFVT